MHEFLRHRQRPTPPPPSIPKAIMLEEFDLRIEQMRHLLAAAQEIPEFRPNNQQPEQIAALIDAGLAARDEDYMPALQTLNLGRQELATKTSAGHEAAIGVYANMRNRFSKDDVSLHAIERLACQDDSPDSTRKQMQQMSALWSKLPVPPNSPLEAMAYVPWQGMNRAVFDSLCSALIGAQSAIPALDQNLQEAQTRLHRQQAILTDFILSGLDQGCARFPLGSWQRALIETIPQQTAEQLPGTACLEVLEIQALRKVVLTFIAPSATSFIVRQKRSGEQAFRMIASGVINKTFITNPLPNGDYEFDAIGHNSCGNGAPSAPIALSV